MSNARPRRRSIFGGLLLILIGALALYHNFRPDSRIWEIFWRYWPLLLILWGLAKLFDYFVSRRSGETAPPRLTGGEIFLLFLLLGVAGAFTGIDWLRLHGPDMDISLGPFDQRYSFTEEVRAGSAKPDPQISVNTDRGDIVIHPGEADAIRVVVKKTVASMNESEAQKRAQHVGVAIQEVSGGYEIQPKVDSDNQRGVRIDLDVYVPPKSSIRAKTKRGDLSISDVAGAVMATSESGSTEIRGAGAGVEVDSRRGTVRVIGARGNVRLKGRGGEIEVADVGGEASIEGEFYGPIRVRNVAKGAHFLSQRTDLTIGPLPGRMEMNAGNLEIYDAPGNVLLTTRNKDIVMENVGGRIHIENRHGDIELRYPQPPREEVEITNASGNVELALPSKSSFEIAASSRSGDVVTDFQDPALKTSHSEDSSSLQGKVGTRGPQFRLRTSYGTIRLRKLG